jgi:predicted metal-dependent hydrolase
MSRSTRALASPQLALFDDALHAVAGTAPPGGVGVGPAAVGHPSPSSPSPPSAECLPSIFRHPRAEREIHLSPHVVAYALKRAHRRSIGFVVGADGLSVNAPKWLGIRDIESALREKAPWILRKLHEQTERARRVQAAKVDWRDGATIAYLGEPLAVRLDPSVAGALLHESTCEAPPGAGRQRALHVGLPHAASAEQIRDAVQSWLQRQARRVFEARCAHYAPLLGVQVRRLGLSSAQTRWGSASSNGSIRLNWRLIHFAPASIDYVVAHELAHLREMNHSPRFWDVVRSVLPGYEDARGSLKDGLVPLLD